MAADLMVRNIWVTSVEMTMKIRAIKAVLLHLRHALKAGFEKVRSIYTSIGRKSSLSTNIQHGMNTNLLDVPGAMERCTNCWLMFV